MGSEAQNWGGGLGNAVRFTPALGFYLSKIFIPQTSSLVLPKHPTVYLPERIQIKIHDGDDFDDDEGDIMMMVMMVMTAYQMCKCRKPLLESNREATEAKCVREAAISTTMWSTSNAMINALSIVISAIIKTKEL